MNEQFQEILSIASSVAGSSRAVLSCANSKTGRLSFLYNTALDWIETCGDHGHPTISKSNPISLLPKEQFARAFQDHPLKAFRPQIHSLATYFVHEDETKRWSLSISNPPEQYFSSDNSQIIVERLVVLLRSLIRSQVPDEPATTAYHADAGLEEPQQQNFHDNTALDFLRETLVYKTRLLSRNAVAYVALCSWAKPIKNHQVKALTALKRGETREAAKFIAEEMHGSVNKMFGACFDKIVPMPFGSSGRPDCLSVAIGEELAKRLNIPVENVLKTQGAKLGKSHPKKSVRLAPFLLEQNISGRALLIDDVATSGKHIEMARATLERSGCSVSAMVWISD